MPLGDPGGYVPQSTYDFGPSPGPVPGGVHQLLQMMQTLHAAPPPQGGLGAQPPTGNNGLSGFNGTLGGFNPQPQQPPLQSWPGPPQGIPPTMGGPVQPLQPAPPPAVIGMPSSGFQAPPQPGGGFGVARPMPIVDRMPAPGTMGAGPSYWSGPMQNPNPGDAQGYLLQLMQKMQAGGFGGGIPMSGGFQGGGGLAAGFGGPQAGLQGLLASLFGRGGFQGL